MNLPGKPDFAFPRQRVAIFVDGCFWHGCPDHYRRPKSRQDFWDAKVAANVNRDCLVNELLAARGWKVLRLWEHELRPRNEAAALEKLALCLSSQPASNAARKASIVL